MKSLFMNCTECYGDGYVTIDLNDTHIPYEQNPVDFACMSCDGKGIALDKEEVEDRIGIIDDMIEGMQTRMRLHSDFIMTAKKGLLHELADFNFASGIITLQNDSDGRGDYIAKWEHTLPRPTDEQLGTL